MKYKEMRLGDVAEINMGQSPNSKYFNSDGKGIEFLQGIRTFGENYPSFDTYTTQYNKISEKGDILFSVRAPVGKINWSDRKIAIGRGLAALKVLPNFSSKYVYYFLKKVGSQINSISSGTVFSSINKKELANVKILIPDSLKDQEYIGTRLALLDKKIELNNQINDNLSKIRNIQYKKLIQTNKTEKVKITDLYKISYGKNLAKSELTNSGTKVFGANGLIGYTLKPGVIKNSTVTITSRGSGSGYVSYLDVGEAFLTNNLLYLNDKNKLGLSFSFETIKLSNPQKFVTGSAQPQLTIKNLSQAKIDIPSDMNIIYSFKNLMYPIELIMKNNNIENDRLQNLKRILLNKFF